MLSNSDGAITRHCSGSVLLPEVVRFAPRCCAAVALRRRLFHLCRPFQAAQETRATRGISVNPRSRIPFCRNSIVHLRPGFAMFRTHAPDRAAPGARRTFRICASAFNPVCSAAFASNLSTMAESVRFGVPAMACHTRQSYGTQTSFGEAITGMALLLFVLSRCRVASE